MSNDNCQESAQLLQTLGLPKGSSWEKVQESYQELMAVWNPERFNGDQALKQRVRKKTSEIKFAYAKLEEMRVAYDKLQLLSSVKSAPDNESPVIAPVSGQMKTAHIAEPRENLVGTKEKRNVPAPEDQATRRARLARQLRFLKPLLFLCVLPFYIVGSVIRVTSWCLDFLYSTTLFQASLRVAVAAMFVFCIYPKARALNVQALLTPDSFRSRYQEFTSTIFDEKTSNVPSPSYYAAFERSNGSMWNKLSAAFSGSESAPYQGDRGAYHHLSPQDSMEAELVKTAYKPGQPQRTRKM